VLRVLGNLLGLEGFGYDTSEQVRDEIGAKVKGWLAEQGLASSR